MRVLTIIGTRPEAIKLIPVVQALRRRNDIESRLCVTAQHREMLDQVLLLFGIQPDYDLNVMRSGQDLTDVTCSVLSGLRDILRDWRPDFVFVQGDTTTAFAGAVAGFYEQIPVAHVEAGLRTGNMYSPWPEEANRRLISVLATLHYAPTVAARENLEAEGVQGDSIYVVGNTVVDALLQMSSRISGDNGLKQELSKQFSFIDSGKRMILVTGHRRENLGEGFEQICGALETIASRGDIQVVFPVHLNPRVRNTVFPALGKNADIHLIEPVDYLSFVYLMKASYLIITDSGGVQEEAPSLGKPVLVTRDTTERPEGVEAGTVRLVGTSAETIVSTAKGLLDDPSAYAAMARIENPYGDGCAAERIVDNIGALAQRAKR